MTNLIGIGMFAIINKDNDFCARLYQEVVDNQALLNRIVEEYDDMCKVCAPHRVEELYIKIIT